MNDNPDRVDRAQQFETLYAEHQARVLAYVLRRTASADDAADVVAETFLVAWRRLDDAPTCEVHLWLYGVARRLLANHRRGELRRTQLSEALRRDLAAHDPVPARSGELDELAAAFRSLSDRDRELLALDAWEQLDAGEIAAVMGCSRNAARIRLHRARQRLRTPDRRIARFRCASASRAAPRSDRHERRRRMSPTTHENPVSRLDPISDTVDAVSPQTWADLGAAIVATPVAPPSRRRREVVHAPARRPVLRVAVGATATAGLVVGAIALSGGGSTGAQPADAAILSGAAAALHPTGSIVVESVTTVQRPNPGYVPPAGGHTGARLRALLTGRWRDLAVTETAAGSGRQNELVLQQPGFVPGVEIGYRNGNNELYDPIDHTVYVASNYGSDITRGAGAGTYVYRLPDPRRPLPRQPSGPPNATLTLTAQQARALRDGTADVGWAQTPKGARMRVTAPFHVPSASAEARAQLGRLEVVGPTTVDGRKAIKLVPIHGAGEYDVQPGTYYPIREIVVSPGSIVTTTWSQYRVLPITSANERLLSLAARHPGARVVSGGAPFRAAFYGRLSTGD